MSFFFVLLLLYPGARYRFKLHRRRRIRRLVDVLVPSPQPPSPTPEPLCGVVGGLLERFALGSALGFALVLLLAVPHRTCSNLLPLFVRIPTVYTLSTHQRRRRCFLATSSAPAMCRVNVASWNPTLVVDIARSSRGSREGDFLLRAWVFSS